MPITAQDILALPAHLHRSDPCGHVYAAYGLLISRFHIIASYCPMYVNHGVIIATKHIRYLVQIMDCFVFGQTFSGRVDCCAELDYFVVVQEEDLTLPI